MMKHATPDAPAPLSRMAAYRRLIQYSRPYLGRLMTGIIFCLLFASSSLGLLLAGKQYIEKVFDPTTQPLRTTLLAALALVVVAIMRSLGSFTGQYLVEWVGNRVVMDLRIAIFDHLQRLSLGYFTRSRTGELISRTSNDTMMVERAVAQVLGDLFSQPFIVIGAAGYLFWLNWKLALLVLVGFPVCILPILVFGRRARRHAREGQKRLADLISHLQETLSGVRIVKAFGTEDFERARFDERSHSVFRRIMQVTRAKISVQPIIEVFATAGLALLLLYVWHAKLSIGEFFAFAAAMVMMYQPVKKLGHLHVIIQQSLAAADRIFEILDTPVDVRDRADAVPFQGPVTGLRFEHAGFAYDAETAVLHDLNLDLAAGQCVALVGSSGSGKTTFVSLLPRFYDVTSGRILLNGRDLREYTTASIRAHMGLVTQETFLFNDSVAYNIAYGRPDAPREAIEEAARRAHAHEFIRQLPQGYDTVIGERGVRLSGGQRQRLAIARALLRNPPILILDEATSALDTESERLVQAALDELMAHRTVFVIAHRLSTIVRADRILVLDQGRVVEDGPHAQLLAKNGVYRRLYDLQFQA